MKRLFITILILLMLVCSSALSNDSADLASSLQRDANIVYEYFKGKAKASTELDNLIKISELLKPGDELYPNESYGHKLGDGIIAMKYYSTLFKVNGRFFTGVINVEVRKNGNRLKDITQIKIDTSRSTLKGIKPDGIAVNNTDIAASVDETIQQNEENRNSIAEKDQPEGYWAERKLFSMAETEDAQEAKLSSALVEADKALRTLRESSKSMKTEADAWVDRLLKAQADGNMDSEMEEYSRWEERYKKVRDDLYEAEQRKKQAQQELDEYQEQRDLEEEQRKIKESGLTEEEYRRKEAVREFGYTGDFREAGYLLPNGKMLNFTGEKGRHTGSRGQDHRAIGTVFASRNMQGGAAMVAFMKGGNIRVMAETPGIDIISTKEPTSEQYSQIFIITISITEYLKCTTTGNKTEVPGTKPGTFFIR